MQACKGKFCAQVIGKNASQEKDVGSRSKELHEADSDTWPFLRCFEGGALIVNGQGKR